MSLVLLDTDVVSYLVKGDSRASQYEPHLIGNETSISLMTVAELFQWAFVRHWGERRTADLERYILRSHTILTIDMATTRLWAQIRAAAHHKGTAISPQDVWVAATALQYNLPFLTHNHPDYEHVDGLNLIRLSD